MITAETDIVVRYAETDQMGIVHHSNYPVWFEAGRSELIKKIGYKYSKFEEMGIKLPLSELRCKYIFPAKYEDELVVVSRISQLGFSRITFSYEVIKKDDKKVIASGETVHAWTNSNLKPVNIKKYMPKVYEIMYSAATE